jgi:hypothetical protein
MRFKKPLKITSRISSVTNGFVQAIIPNAAPSRSEEAEVLAKLGMSSEAQECIFCGQKATDWDHLLPLVKQKRPTGYINSAKNRVPACGPCNHSKSGAEWQNWMTGKAKGAPRQKGVTDIDERIEKIANFAKWADQKPIKFNGIIGAELWDKYWNLHAEIEEKMRAAQQCADAIQRSIKESGALSSPLLS